ncbi:MAG: hypothetical protein AB2785_11170 [Candidatus Thiodiazotropha endolucinida]
MELNVDKKAQKLIFFIIVFFIFGGLFAIYELAKGDDIFGKVFLFVWLGGVSYGVYYTLRQPTTIQLNEKSREMYFRNKFREKRLNISCLRKIIIDNQVLSFHFEDQTVSMHHQITGLHSLITKLKSMKPEIEVKGC